LEGAAGFSFSGPAALSLTKRIEPVSHSRIHGLFPFEIGGPKWYNTVSLNGRRARARLDDFPNL
jgi:hypothetical protein